MRDMRKSQWKQPNGKQRALADGLRAGKDIKSAMVEAGYSEQTADRGMASVPKTVQVMLARSNPLIQLSKRLNWEDHQHLVLGRLAVNTMEGKDGGAQSAKILGSHKALNMWTSENQVGVLVINAPTEGPKEED